MAGHFDAITLQRNKIFACNSGDRGDKTPDSEFCHLCHRDFTVFSMFNELFYALTLYRCSDIIML